MSKEEGIAGRDAMGRRVWDKEYFKHKYEASASSSQEPPSKRLVAAPTSSLKARSDDLTIDEKVNERRIVSVASGKTQQGGFYCETCDMLFRDSTSYLDHVNGRAHNRLLGMTMKVEEVTVERVIEKMKRIRAGLS